MKRHVAIALTSFTLAIAGCSSSQYAGTWSSHPAEPEGDFRLGGMTLSTDGTYTAFADYGGTTRGFSGTWEIETTDGQDVLVFQTGRPGAEPARYAVTRDADDSNVLIIEEPQSGTTTRLVAVAAE